MHPPRARALSTRLLLLLEVHNHRHARLRTLADRLDITVQAVSDYLKRLTNEGLVESAGGAWRPTKKGTALLHDTMRDLRRFVDESLGRLRIIEETYALADRRLHAEQEVGLYMRDGRLYAGPPRGLPSRGRARTEAEAGHLVLVGELKGMMRLEPAPLTLLVHPDFPTGAALERARREVRRGPTGPRRRLVAAHGLTSLAWIQALGLEAHLEFAAAAAAQDAAARGVPVLYFVPRPEAAALEASVRAEAAQRNAPLPLRRVEL